MQEGWRLVTGIEDYRRSARRKLPAFLFEYLDGGALNELTLAHNSSDFASLFIRQRVLRDVETRRLQRTLFGQSMEMPLALSPVGMAGMYARRGEVQAAKAAHAAGIPFTLSTVAICDLEEVKHGADISPWYQLYVTRDRSFMHRTIDRAESLGVKVLVLTVDMPVPGTRYRDQRTGLSATPGSAQQLGLYMQSLLRPTWAWDVGLRGRPHQFGNVDAVLEGDFGVAGFWRWMGKNFDPTVNWDDLSDIRKRWRGTLLVKGILDATDAQAAIGAGADGLIVSNHGGRQLDGASSTIRALPAIRQMVGESIPVLLDGGIRSGVDLFKALAAGADMGMIGRPWVYALAAQGQKGVANLLAMFSAELSATMAFAGVTEVASISGSNLLSGEII